MEVERSPRPPHRDDDLRLGGPLRTSVRAAPIAATVPTRSGAGPGSRSVDACLRYERGTIAVAPQVVARPRVTVHRRGAFRLEVRSPDLAVGGNDDDEDDRAPDQPPKVFEDARTLLLSRYF